MTSPRARTGTRQTRASTCLRAAEETAASERSAAQGPAGNRLPSAEGARPCRYGRSEPGVGCVGTIGVFQWRARMVLPRSPVTSNRRSGNAMAPGPRRAGPAATTTPPSTSTKRVHGQSDYAALAKRLQAAGLMRRRPGYYLTLLLTLVAALTCIAILFMVLGDSWWQLCTAVLLAFTLAQFGFLGHDAAHQQVLSSSRGNAWLARVVSICVVGLSYGWWTHKHNRHHSAPNQVGRDPDIEPGALVFTAEDATRRSALARWLTARQGVLFFPLLLLEGVNLHVASFRVLVARPDLPWRRLEAGMVTLRLGGY